MKFGQPLFFTYGSALWTEGEQSAAFSFLFPFLLVPIFSLILLCQSHGFTKYLRILFFDRFK
uniref:Uncharacterized protein n=1 Tax=Meloidogyne incognita TaxID=6306 RepID=A0A914MP10_MELIC